DVEHERGVRRNRAARAARTVAELRGNDERPLPADLHPRDALIPPLNHAARAEAERKRVVAVTRAVEFLAVPVRPVRVVQPAGVVDRNVLPGGGDGTVPHSAVRDLQARDVVHTVHLAIELSGHRVIRAGRSVSHRTGAAYQLTRLFSYTMVRISFPMCMLDSMTRCAAAASRSGNV